MVNANLLRGSEDPPYPFLDMSQSLDVSIISGKRPNTPDLVKPLVDIAFNVEARLGPERSLRDIFPSAEALVNNGYQVIAVNTGLERAAEGRFSTYASSIDPGLLLMLSPSVIRDNLDLPTINTKNVLSRWGYRMALFLEITSAPRLHRIIDRIGIATISDPNDISWLYERLGVLYKVYSEVERKLAAMYLRKERPRNPLFLNDESFRNLGVNLPSEVLLGLQSDELWNLKVVAGLIAFYGVGNYRELNAKTDTRGNVIYGAPSSGRSKHSRRQR